MGDGAMSWHNVLPILSRQRTRRPLTQPVQGILQQAAVGSPGSAPGTPTAGGAPAAQQQPDVRLVLPLMERVTTIFRQAWERLGNGCAALRTPKLSHPQGAAGCKHPVGRPAARSSTAFVTMSEPLCALLPQGGEGPC